MPSVPLETEPACRTYRAFQVAEVRRLYLDKERKAFYAEILSHFWRYHFAPVVILYLGNIFPCVEDIIIEIRHLS
jgi:hypothetical protein